MVASVEAVIDIEKKDDNRKSNKPIMEKRRRARINNCLNDLKALILDAMKKDPGSHSKLEKADILEMTVKHLGGLRSRGSSDRFLAGYRRCLAELARFPGLEVELRKKLVRHLEGLAPGVRPPIAPTPPSDFEDATVTPSTDSIYAGVASGVFLVPTRLPNGDMALLLPASVSPNTLRKRPTLGGSFGIIPNRVALSPAYSIGSPSADVLPLALVTKKSLEDKPWRPW